MIFYTLLIVSAALDIVNFKTSNNTTDIKKYIITVILIALLGIFFLMYKNQIELVHYVLKYFNIEGMI